MDVKNILKRVMKVLVYILRGILILILAPLGLLCILILGIEDILTNLWDIYKTLRKKIKGKKIAELEERIERLEEKLRKYDKAFEKIKRISTNLREKAASL